MCASLKTTPYTTVPLPLIYLGLCLVALMGLWPTPAAANGCDITPCDDNGDSSATCSDAPPSGNTCTCTSGYASTTVSGTTRTCTNVDGCAVNACDDNGDTGSACHDVAPPGTGNTCSCTAGYSLSTVSGTLRTCRDTNGCSANFCDDNGDTSATCKDVAAPGTGNTCICSAGYAQTTISGTLRTCSNIDECAGNPCDDRGDSNGVCIESAPGLGYTCTCGAGYEFNTAATPSCVDHDECADPINPCGAGGCVNTMGSYTCTCPAGFDGTGTTGCSDVDECATSTDACDANATCSNLVGGYLCACKPGWFGSGITCADEDECTLGHDDCDDNATCTNKDGSFTCACKPGYEGDGLDCTDVDECATETDKCDANATCSNTDGGYDCACDPGYHDISGGTGREGQCDDDDECSLGGAQCDVHADCHNVVGSYACACWDTYSGDGISCLDVDECATGDARCTLGHVCHNAQPEANADPGYECVCPAGQTEDASGACAVICGDKVLDVSEGCEGSGGPEGGCDACRTETGYVCLFDAASGESTCSSTCGDGFLDDGEQCDDGDANTESAPDTCRNCVSPRCGDNIVDPSDGEECDGAFSDEAADACRSNCKAAACGDRVRDSGEACDDGNQALGDGCNASCGVESGAVCVEGAFGEPDRCTFPEPDAGTSDDAGTWDAGSDPFDAGGTHESAPPEPSNDGDHSALDGDGSISPSAPNTRGGAGCSVSPRSRAPSMPLLLGVLGVLALAVRRRTRR